VPTNELFVVNDPELELVLLIKNKKEKLFKFNLKYNKLFNDNIILDII
jgi:hypothetical protein